jgi:Galactose oxidase, central domain
MVRRALPSTSSRLPRVLWALVVAGVCTLALTGCPPPLHDASDAGPDPDGSWRLRRLDDVSTAGTRWGQIPAYTSAGTYLIGGADIDLSDGAGPVLADVWRVDVDGAAPVFNLVSDTGGVPRYCGCAAMNGDRDEILVIGGRNQENMVIHDAWIFSVNDGSWTEVEGELPDGMVGCGAVFIPGEDTAYVFGGGSDAFVSSATLRFDGGARTFTSLDLQDGPSGRFDHQLRPSSDFSHLWLVSGSLTAVTGFSPEVWRFEVTSESWSLLEVTGEQPPGRRTPWVAIHDDDTSLVMGFGTAGLAPESDLDDLWQLDLETGVWTFLDVQGLDEVGARAFTYFLRAPAGGVGLVYGGTDMVSALDDLWVLEAPGGDDAWH